LASSLSLLSAYALSSIAYSPPSLSRWASSFRLAMTSSGLVRRVAHIIAFRIASFRESTI